MIKRRLRRRSAGTWTIVDSIAAGLASAPSGYTQLSKCPEVSIAVDYIADIVSNMALMLMENGEGGDVRVRNELSRKLDIEPCRGMTRKSWVQTIVRTLLLEGDGNAVVMPTYTRDGLIENLIPVPAGNFSFNLGRTFSEGYKVQIDNREYDSEDVIHFALNPDPKRLWIGRGYRIILTDLVGTLGAGQETKTRFMNGRYMPSVIVKADVDAEEISTDEGKDKIVGKYLKSANAGEPWVIPTELMEVEQIKPLSLSDIAITDTIAQDKSTVARILGVPPFVLGVGEYDQDAYNNFVKDKVLSVAKVLEQTLTKALLINPNWYFKFNIRSTYSYDMEALAEVGDTLYSHGVMTGNEVRDWIGLSPMEGLDELTILENYIPAADIGNQKKLEDNGGDSGGGDQSDTEESDE